MMLDIRKVKVPFGFFGEFVFQNSVIVSLLFA